MITSSQELVKSTPLSEKITMSFFNFGALVGFSAIASGVGQHKSSNELTSNVTAAFLMSINGNGSRILGKADSFLSEKIFITLAVASYSYALFLDLERTHPILDVYSKLFTTGSVGAWNALQMIRLHKTKNAVVGHHIDTKIAALAFASYFAGAGVGYITFVMGVTELYSSEELKPFITFAFLMSHCGNFIRTESNPRAHFFEKNTIRLVVLFYSMALFCDFLNTNEQVKLLSAYSKLVAAGGVGLWNTAQTLRLHPTVYDGVGRIVNAFKASVSLQLSTFSMFSKEPARFQTAVVTPDKLPSEVSLVSQEGDIELGQSRRLSTTVG